MLLNKSMLFPDPEHSSD